ncbi:MAG TPA: MerR family transcriptional regulator [Kofleriaceae bacterium]|jgi:DNA-binding transcriptional MerR regulator
MRKKAAAPSREFSIDELARQGGTTVRNVRAYQDKGLVPPPRRKGRSGIYTDSHLARLRLIHALLGRGYTLANIAELIAAWEGGRELEEVLGLEVAVASPFSTEPPGYVDAEALAAVFGREPDALRSAIELGLVVPDGARFRVPSPRTLEAGAELIRAGVPLPEVLDLLRAIRRDVERIANRLVETIVERVLGGRASRRLPRAAELAPFADLVWRLRPLADRVVGAELARALEGAAREHLGERVDRVIEAMHDGPRKPVPTVPIKIDRLVDRT